MSSIKKKGIKHMDTPYYYSYLYGNIENKEMYSIACRFLDEQYATLSHYTVEKNKRRHMRMCCDIISELCLKNVESSTDITLNHLKNFMIEKQNKFGKKDGYLRSMIRALYWLKSNGLILNEEVLHLLSFEAPLLDGCLKASKFFEVLNSPNIKNYFYYFDKNRRTHYFQYMNIKCRELFFAWCNFYKQYKNHRTKSFQTTCLKFDDSLYEFNINSIDDITFETFKAQIRYFGKYEDKLSTAPITAFYLYLSQNYNQKLFKESGYDTKLLLRIRIAQELLKGFEVINYNPYDDIPKEDKWLLSYNDIEDTNTAVNTVKSRLIDFTKVKSEIYRYWLKHYIWKNRASLMTKLQSYSLSVEFLNYVYDLKQGTVCTIFTGKSYRLKTPDEKITISEVVAYKHYILAKELSNESQSGLIFQARNLLNHVSYNNLALFESGVFYNLNIKKDVTINADAILIEDINKIAEYMKNKYEDDSENILFEIYYVIFCLTQETEFRSSAIFALTTDCVKEANKDNQYVIESKTKTSAGEEIPQVVTIYTKRLIDHIIKITDKYRRNCTIDDIKNRIFLAPGLKKNTYKIIQWDDFNRYFKKCCRELGLKEYSLENLRDTYMTRANDYITKKELSNVVGKVFTGHKNPNSDYNYLDTDIRTLLEAVHGIIIGNVDIKGNVIEEVSADVATTENSVSHQCGYCGSKSCHDLSYLDCLMCSSFITTISRIPYFKEQIAVIDRKIEAAVIHHDKEDLVNIKRLLVEYLTRLLILKKEYEKTERSVN